jgi:hypothetical protein
MWADMHHFFQVIARGADLFYLHVGRPSVGELDIWHVVLHVPSISNKLFIFLLNAKNKNFDKKLASL